MSDNSDISLLDYGNRTNSADALFLNTGMLHRGKKPKFNNRNVLILSYAIHDEVNSTQKFTLRKWRTITLITW